jgi:hypothetical protein
MRRDTKEVLTELVGKLKEKLDPKKPAATSAGEKHKRGELRPNLDRLTVGVDLGDHGQAEKRSLPRRLQRGTL